MAVAGHGTGLRVQQPADVINDRTSADTALHVPQSTAGSGHLHLGISEWWLCRIYAEGKDIVCKMGIRCLACVMIVNL